MSQVCAFFFKNTVIIIYYLHFGLCSLFCIWTAMSVTAEENIGQEKGFFLRMLNE